LIRFEDINFINNKAYNCPVLRLCFGCEAGVCVWLFRMYMSASIPVTTWGVVGSFRCSVYMLHLFCIVYFFIASFHAHCIYSSRINLLLTKKAKHMRLIPTNKQKKERKA